MILCQTKQRPLIFQYKRFIMKINICYCIAYAEAEVERLPEIGEHITISDNDSYFLLEDLRSKVSPEVYDEFFNYLSNKEGYWYEWRINHIEDRNGKIIYHLEPTDYSFMAEEAEREERLAEALALMTQGALRN